MKVRIAPDVEARIKRTPGRIVIQVQDAPDPEGAAIALERARPDIDKVALKGARDVERIPSGPFVMVVDRDDGQRRMLEVPDVVARHLDAGGIEGTIACIDQGGSLTSSLWGLPTVGPGLVCRLYPPPPEIPEDPPTGLPDGWVAEAAAWVIGGLPPDHALWCEVGLVEFSLPAGEVATFLEQQRRHRRSALVVAARARPVEAGDPGSADAGGLGVGEIGRPLRAVALWSGPSQVHLALGAGGPGAVAHLPALFEQLAALTRRLAGGLAYGFIDMAPTFLRFAGAHHPLEPYCDEAVFDGFPYQVLGPGHLARLGGPPPGTQPLAGGRVELSVDDPTAWIAEEAAGRPASLGLRGGPHRQPVQRLLRPCLELDGQALREQRWERVKRRRLDLEDLAAPQYQFDPPA